MRVATEAFPRDVVHHRGHWYPRTLTATFEGDDMDVTIEVLVEETRGAIPTSVTIRSDAGVTGLDMQKPVIKMAQRAAKQLAFTSRQTGSAESGAVYEVRRAPSTAVVKMGKLPQRTAAPLKDVARHYRDAIAAQKAIANGESPSGHVSEYLAARGGDGMSDHQLLAVGRYVGYQLDVGHHRAYQLIREARKADLLPPTERGRKKA